MSKIYIILPELYYISYMSSEKINPRKCIRYYDTHVCNDDCWYYIEFTFILDSVQVV